MSKIRDTDYLTISARVRAMENRLVTRERMERMVEARSDDEAVEVLAEFLAALDEHFDPDPFRD